jgi:hypothetical protein
MVKCPNVEASLRTWTGQRVRKQIQPLLCNWTDGGEAVNRGPIAMQRVDQLLVRICGLGFARDLAGSTVLTQEQEALAR